MSDRELPEPRHWLGCAAATLVVVSSILPNLADRFVYYPTRYPEGTWDLQAACGAEDRWLRAEDGTRLHAWWFAQQNTHIATLFLHGNAGNVTHRIDHAQAVLEAGSAFLILDYRGYGKSQGRPSERGFYQDADAAYAELLDLGYSPDRVIVQGESLGTAVAVDIAVRRRCAGLILESPLMSVGKVAGIVTLQSVPKRLRNYSRELRRDFELPCASTLSRASFLTCLLRNAITKFRMSAKSIGC